MSWFGRKILHHEVVASLKKYYEGSIDNMPRSVVYSDELRKLKKRQIIQAVVIFTCALNLSGGSVGNINLYDLLIKYLLNENAREELNLVLSKYQQSEKLVRKTRPKNSEWW